MMYQMVSLLHILQGPLTMANLDFCQGERGGRSGTGVERDGGEGMTRGLRHGRENTGGKKTTKQIFGYSLAQQE